MKKVILVALGLLLIGAPVLAGEEGGRREGRWEPRGASHQRGGDGESRKERLEQKGDRVRDRLDERGDRINERLDQKAAVAETQGKARLADHLDKTGDRINARLDQKGERIHDRMESRGNRR